MNYLAQHWGAILIALGILSSVLATIANRLGPKVPKWLEIVIDVLALVPQPGKSGLLGPLNVPGCPSLSKPPTAPTSIVPFLIAGGICGMIAAGCLAGCANSPPEVKQFGVDVQACALGAVPNVAADLAQQAIGSLMNGASWASWAAGPLLARGENIAACAVLAAINDLGKLIPKHGEADPKVLAAISRGKAWLEEHNIHPKLQSHVERALLAYELGPMRFYSVSKESAVTPLRWWLTNASMEVDPDTRVVSGSR